MRVCMLTTSYPRFEGDYAGVFVHELAKNLVEKKVDVTVVAPHDGDSPTSEIMNKVNVERFIYMRPKMWQRVAYHGGIPANLRRRWSTWLQLPLFCLAFLVRGWRKVRECDVIHAHWVYSGLIAALITLTNRKPIVLTVHGSDLNWLAGISFLRPILSYVINRADMVVTVSKPLSEIARDLGVDKDRVMVIPNGVDTSVFVEAKVEAEFGYRLLWIGRMIPVKGLEYLIKALPRVLDSYPEARLTLVGDGPIRSELCQLANDLKLNGFIDFAGLANYEDIPGYLAGSDLVVLPSLSEGLPLVLLEAMSAGCPVVATDVGGIPELVITQGEQQNGLLVEPGDSETLAEAIVDMFGNGRMARKMGRNGRRRVEEGYSWDAVAVRIKELYGVLSPT